jgi:hypothetical protein
MTSKEKSKAKPVAAGRTVLISYAWGDGDQQAAVRLLAEHLQQNGVTAKLDQWHLKEGQDKFVFMEQMVNNPEVDKVLLLCDPKYKRKADERAGGVGTEAQIISRELYEKVDQEKFIPIIWARNEDGSEAMPTFVAARIYVDMSNEEARTGNFEKLMRVIYGMPEHEPPPLGKPPAYLEEKPTAPAPWRSALEQAMTAFKAGRSNATNLLFDMVDIVGTSLLEAGPKVIDGMSADDRFALLIGAVDATVPARDALVNVMGAAARYVENEERLGEALHRAMESLLVFAHPRRDHPDWKRYTTEDLKFTCYETMIYVVALLLRERKFGALMPLLHGPYIVPPGSDAARRQGSVDFTAFEKRDLEVFREWNIREERKDHGWVEPAGEYLKRRPGRRDISWDGVREADFFLYVTSIFGDRIWRPVTAVYAPDRGEVFGIFGRCASKTLFAKVAAIWGGVDVSAFRARVAQVIDSGMVPRQNIGRVAIEDLMGLATLATKP